MIMQRRSLKSMLRDVSPRFLDGLWARVERSHIGERLLRGTFWTLLGTIASRALGLAAAILAARILGKMVYGELGIIQSTVGMLGTFAGFGMGTTATKYVAELRSHDPVKAGGIIAISSLVSWGASFVLFVALYLAAPWLCLHTLAAPQLTWYLRLSGLLLVVSGINGAQLGVLSGFEAFKSVARISFLTGLLNFPMIVGGAFFFNLRGIIAGMILAQALGCVLNLYAVRREMKRYHIPVSFTPGLREIRVVWRFSIPAVLGSALISVVNWVAATMLVHQRNGYSEMGLFSAANQWFNALMWFPYVLSGVTLPLLAERLGSGDKAAAIKLLKMTLGISAAVLLPVTAIGCVLSRHIMMSYGRDFASGWPTLITVLITAAILGLVVIVGELMAALGHMWLGFLLNIGFAVIFLGAASFLLKWGALGLASSRLVAYSIYTVFMGAYLAYFVLRRHVNSGSLQAHTVDTTVCVTGGDIAG
jgi:O-antigen/teichoic acid export membrane protein